MNHFSPAEFADAADGALPPRRLAHVDGCRRCREQLAELREALDAARAVDGPEPSPLYWRHFAARVHDGVAAESIASAWPARWRALFTLRALIPVASALVLVAAVGVATELGRARPAPVPDAGAAPAPPPMLAAEAVEPENSDVWQMLTSAAHEMPIEDAHAAGMGVPSGAIDRAVQRMTPAELNELGRLLRTEMRGSGD